MTTSAVFVPDFQAWVGGHFGKSLFVLPINNGGFDEYDLVELTCPAKIDPK